MPILNEPIHAPEFQSGEWINSSPLTMSSLKGTVVLIDFWDYTCINCLRSLPYVQEWWRRYHEHGLQVIGVHSPEFTFAKDSANVRTAVLELGIEYPVLLDNSHLTWQVWATRYWPSKYLVDTRGYIRYFQYGEGQYQDFELDIQHLLHELYPEMAFPPPMEAIRPSDIPGVSCLSATPEQYLGFRRGQLGNREEYAPNQVVLYAQQQTAKEDAVYLQGQWYNDSEAIVLAGMVGSLEILYKGKEVNIVATPPKNGIGVITVEQDNLPIPKEAFGRDMVQKEDQSIVRIDAPRLYNIIDNPHFGIHLLRLSSKNVGIALYTITFITECRNVTYDLGQEAA